MSALLPVAAPVSAPDIGQLEAELDRTARTAGIGPEDPLWPVLQSWKALIRGTLERAAHSDRAVLEAARRFELLQGRLEAQQTLNLEVLQSGLKRMYAEARTACLQSAGEIGTLIADSQQRTMVRRAKVLDRESILATAAVMILVLLVAVAGGRIWGRLVSIGEVDAVVGDVQLSLGNRIEDARAMALLAERNPLADEIRTCLLGGYQMWKGNDGRLLCAMPIALDQVEAPPGPPQSPIVASQAPPPPPPPAAASPPIWAFPGAPPTGPVKFHD